jgi:hypothetical protein
MANNRELSELGDFLTIDEGANNNVGIATTVRISAGGLYVDGVEVIGPGGAWKGPNSGLVGAQGTQGAQGYQGVQGEVGAQGAQGSDGAQGAQGAQGYQGRQGSPGAQGAQGADGAQGAQGAQGYQGRQGSPGAQGTQGAPGPQGSQGAQGYQGRQGAPGAQGDSGTAVVRAWGNFNSTGSSSANATINASYNISSVYKVSTGRYQANYSTSFSDNDYAFVATGDDQATGGQELTVCTSTQYTYSTSQTEFKSVVNWPNGCSQVSYGNIYFACFR